LSADRFSASPAPSSPTPKFKGNVYVLTEKEGGRSKPFFNRLSSAVLLQNYRRYRRYQSLPEGVEMCRPGDNVDHERRAYHPDRYRKGSPLRYPRGRQNSRLRRCNRNYWLILHRLMPGEGRPAFSGPHKDKNITEYYIFSGVGEIPHRR
jgi:hypothetical protein